jgi:hypothetical protein
MATLIVDEYFVFLGNSWNKPQYDPSTECRYVRLDTEDEKVWFIDRVKVLLDEVQQERLDENMWEQARHDNHLHVATTAYQAALERYYNLNCFQRLITPYPKFKGESAELAEPGPFEEFLAAFPMDVRLCYEPIPERFYVAVVMGYYIQSDNEGETHNDRFRTVG